MTMTRITHNFATRRRDFSYTANDGGLTITISGTERSSARFQEGDYIIFAGPSPDGLLRYKITSIRFTDDSSGNYEGTVEYCNWSDEAWKREYPFIRAALSAGIGAWETP